MCMAIKLQGWKDGVTCNYAWAIVKRGSFPAAILECVSFKVYVLREEPMGWIQNFSIKHGLKVVSEVHCDYSRVLNLKKSEYWVK